MKINKKNIRIMNAVLFAVYMIALVYFMFFAESLGRGSGFSNYHYNLVPFKEIFRFLRYQSSLGIKVVFLNVFGNVIAFIPFGLFLPSVINNRFNYLGMAFLTFDVSLLIELWQLFSKVGRFDVDDLMLNTLGGILGYMIYCMICKYRMKRIEAKNGESKI